MGRQQKQFKQLSSSESLALAEQELIQGNWIKLLNEVGELAWRRFVREGRRRELDQLIGLIPAPALDPNWNRAQAMVAERSESFELNGVQELWVKYVRDVADLGAIKVSEVRISVFQGENRDVRNNQSVGEFLLEGLDQKVTEPSEILVRFDLNLDGILMVTAVERATSLEQRLTIDNAITRFRAKNRDEARAKLAEMFGGSDTPSGFVRAQPEVVAPSPKADPPWIAEIRGLLGQARRLSAQAPAEDAEEISRLSLELETAIVGANEDDVREMRAALEDVLFYLEDA